MYIQPIQNLVEKYHEKVTIIWELCMAKAVNYWGFLSRDPGPLFPGTRSDFDEVYWVEVQNMKNLDCPSLPIVCRHMF